MLLRFISLKDAPNYLGMDRNRFNVEVRPKLIEIPIGVQGIAFDRLDLDMWAEHYKKCNGRPTHLRRKLWNAKEHQVLLIEKSFGISTRRSIVTEFTQRVITRSGGKGHFKKGGGGFNRWMQQEN